MQYRKFGNTDMNVSAIGFGAWAIGGGAMIGNSAIGWGDADDATSKKALLRAVDAGINFFDTADVYGLGHSESLIGDTISANKNVLITTKVGNVARGEKFTTDYSTGHILQACEASLRRLKRETIDYYQLHSARVQQLQSGECVAAMQLLQQQGKIRYWGISLNTFEPAPEANFLLDNDLGDGFQLVLNIINQRALPLIKKMGEKKVGVIARMPLQFGLLTGKFQSNTVFAANDHRKGRLTREIIELATKELQPIWALSSKYGINLSQLALSYLLSYAAVSVVIPGIRTPAHVEDNTSGIVQLSAEDLASIEKAGASKFLPLMDLIQRQG